jgi:hypothetical protein
MAGEKEPVALERKYLFTPEDLAKKLGLQGDRVNRVVFDYGVFDVFTTEDLTKKTKPKPNPKAE